MKYYKVASHLFAVEDSGENPKTYMCRITGMGEQIAQICTGKAADHQKRMVETMKPKVEITAEEFQKTFSKVVESLANNTPFA